MVRKRLGGFAADRPFDETPILTEAIGDGAARSILLCSLCPVVFAVMNLSRHLHFW